MFIGGLGGGFGGGDWNGNGHRDPFDGYVDYTLSSEESSGERDSHSNSGSPMDEANHKESVDEGEKAGYGCLAVFAVIMVGLVFLAAIGAEWLAGILILVGIVGGYKLITNK